MMTGYLKSGYFAVLLALLFLATAPGAGAAQPAAVPTVSWQFPPGDAAVVGQALGEDGAHLVLVLGHGFDPGGEIVSLDPETGAERWSVEVAESPWSSPVIAHGVVYAGIGSLVSGQSAVYALDAETGAQRWRTDVTNRDLPATPVDGLALSGDTLFVNRGDGVVLALDAAAGAERWTVELPKPQRGTPFVDGDTVYVSTGFDGAILFALDTATGETRWEIEQPTNPTTGPVVADGLLYVGFTNGDVVAFDAANGEERWRAPGGLQNEGASPPWPGLPLVVDGVLYVSGNGFSGASTMAFDALTGALLWSANTGDFSAEAPALDGNVLLVGSDTGELLGLDAASGAELWRVAIPNKIGIDLNQEEPPLVADDRIYLVDDIGGLVALEFSVSEA